MSSCLGFGNGMGAQACARDILGLWDLVGWHCAGVVPGPSTNCRAFDGQRRVG